MTNSLSRKKRPLSKFLTASTVFCLCAPAATAAAASLDSIQVSFGGRTDSEAVAMVAITVGTLSLLAVILVLLRRYHERRNKLTPLGWLDSPKQVFQILQNAVHYRSTFELQFPHRGFQRRPILRCAPDDISSRGLTLEADGIKHIARNWTERPVNCYFKINVKGQHVYYAFSTRIKRVEIKPRGRCNLTLYLPERLENRQKRSFLRIVPPSEYMLGAVLWFGGKMPKLEDLPNMERWPRPALVMLPGTDRRQFEISDISAGGVRLTIPRKNLLDEGLELGIAEHLVMILDLLNPDDRSRMRLWIHCRVQNFAAQYDTHNIDTGLQFLAWAAPKGGQGTLEWFNLSRNLEIDQLGNWIIRRHLELFRDTPEEDEERRI